MSLVEKALKKLHDQRAAGGVDGTVVRRPDGVSDGVGMRAPRAEIQAAPVQTEAPPAPRNNKVITINLAALRSAGLLAAEDEQRRIASEFRQIKRPLIAAAVGKGATPAIPGGRIIMVASALPGEGKTFTSVNLAFNLALENDTSVLLVDADLPKPHISNVLGIAEERGLVDVLLDESADIESTVLDTNVRGLSVMPAGKPCSTATELLASARMERVVAELLKRDPRRILLFDSSPLLLTTESRSLSTAVGQIVVVVRAESTTRQAVTDAVAYLGEDKAVGLVLNQSRAEAVHSYYGYGDYYGGSERAPAE